MARCRPLLGCLVAALLVAFAAPNASAEDEYTDAKLHSFASAVLAVNAIVERWRPSCSAISRTPTLAFSSRKIVRRSSNVSCR